MVHPISYPMPPAVSNSRIAPVLRRSRCPHTPEWCPRTPEWCPRTPEWCPRTPEWCPRTPEWCPRTPECCPHVSGLLSGCFRNVVRILRNVVLMFPDYYLDVSGMLSACFRNGVRISSESAPESCRNPHIFQNKLYQLTYQN